MKVSRFTARFLGERGSMLTLLAICIPVIIGVVALAVDLSRLQLTKHHVRNTAESMALAGAGELDASLDGWRNARRAALMVLRDNDIYTVSESTKHSIQLDDPAGEIDPLPIESSSYASTQGMNENLRITVERGLYRRSLDPKSISKFEFQPLESGAPIDISSSANQAPIPVTVAYETPAFLLANAVRVSISLDGIRNRFANIFGITHSREVQEVVIATSNSNFEACVLPVGIPACALTKDTTPYANTYSQTQYNPRQACEREMLAIEANYENPNRMDGLWRSMTYPRPPYIYPTHPEPTGELLDPDHPSYLALDDRNLLPMLNYWATPLLAVLGVPERTDNAAPANVIELTRTLKQQNGCIPATIGDRFRPLDDGIGNGLFGNPELIGAVADLINDKNKPGNYEFRKVFGEPTNQNQYPMKPNFPFQRTLRKIIPDVVYRAYDELILFKWPSLTLINVDGASLFPGVITPPDVDQRVSVGQNLATGNTYTSVNSIHYPMHPDTWTNPMCHSDSVQNADDPDHARVKEVKIAVIEPSRSGVNYCDHQALQKFQSPKTSTLPLANTEPVVVGFITAYLYDFRLQAYKDETPTFTLNGRDVVDRSPALPAAQNGFGLLPREYVLDQTSWYPVSVATSRVPQNPAGIDRFFWSLDHGAGSSNSYQFPDTSGRGLDLSLYLDASALDTCFETPVPEVLPFEPPQSWYDGNFPYTAKKDMHCLPMKVDNCDAPVGLGVQGCWDNGTHHRKAQYGCGGLRMRLSCEDTFRPRRGLPGAQEARPTIVR